MFGKSCSLIVLAVALILQLGYTSWLSWPRKSITPNLNLASQPSSQILTERPATFLHGVASGDPTVSSVIIWTRIEPKAAGSTVGSIPIKYIVSTGSDLSGIIRQGTTATNSEADYTVKLDITGLLPGTTYYYAFFVGDNKSTIGRTRTLPKSDSTEPLKLAVYSCSNYAGGFFHAYRHPAVEDDVDYVLHLGDYIYEHSNGNYTDGTEIGRVHNPNKTLWTLEDYRGRHAQYRSDADLQLSHSKFPWIAVWDDHEVSDNSWRHGSVDSEGIDFEKRRQQAFSAYFEWMPIRPHQPDKSRIWRSVNLGKIADLFMMDTRHYSRDVTDIYTNTEYIADISDRSERTLLGFDQENWLLKGLNESESNWKLLGNQLVMQKVDFSILEGLLGDPFVTKNYDSWDGYQSSRKRLLDFISSNKIDDVVVLSGDTHVFWVNELYKNVSDYNPETGDGTVAVELGTSAVSSPSIYRGFDIDECTEISRKIIENNTGVLWNEGFWRGYLKLDLSMDQIQASFFAFDVLTSSYVDNGRKIASFTIKKKANHIHRPISRPLFGVVDSHLVD